jgi:2-polyprenyl-3-methyl-5-hydroxy-6-metoxy-1,4-benzoquinol methylase
MEDTWTFGDATQKHNVNLQVLSRYLAKGDTETALDLGCGSGFQSIPLLKLGFHVTAIDLSPQLLNELTEEATKNISDPCSKLTTIQGDLLGFSNLVKGSKFNHIVCMG